MLRLHAEGRRGMDRKLFCLAGILFVVCGLVLSSPVNGAQKFGNNCQSDCDCYGQTDGCDKPKHGCCRELWRCLYGTMVSDGIGGSFRVYGYPRQRYCGSTSCGYPYFVSGCKYPYGYPQSSLKDCPTYPTRSYIIAPSPVPSVPSSASAGLPTRIN